MCKLNIQRIIRRFTIIRLHFSIFVHFSVSLKRVIVVSYYIVTGLPVFVGK